MPVSQNKLNDLKKSGYKYDFTKDIYINVKNKIIISKEAIEDHDDAWLNKKLQSHDGRSWLFIFTNESPKDTVKQKILNDLGH